MSGNIFGPGLTGGRFIGGNPTQPTPDPAAQAGSVGDDFGRQYFNTDPSAYWGRYVDQLGGPNTALGKYAAGRLSDAWTAFTRASTNNPGLKFADFADQNYNARNIQQQYALSSPFQRNPYDQPQWAATRYLS
jgi:hypothetical protein